MTVRFHSPNRNEPQRRSPSLQYAGRWITAAIEINSAISPAVIEVMEFQPIAAKAIWHRQFSGHGLGLCPDPHVVGSSARALRPSGAYRIWSAALPFFRSSVCQATQHGIVARLASETTSGRPDGTSYFVGPGRSCCAPSQHAGGDLVEDVRPTLREQSTLHAPPNGRKSSTGIYKLPHARLIG